jgi:hypothetical protein
MGCFNSAITHRALPWLLLISCGSCSFLPQPCRQARAEHQRQQQLAANASPGGIDQQAMRAAKQQQRRACGFSW